MHKLDQNTVFKENAKFFLWHYLMLAKQAPNVHKAKLR
jgi:hypothetical protein